MVKYMERITKALLAIVALLPMAASRADRQSQPVGPDRVGVEAQIRRADDPADVAALNGISWVRLRFGPDDKTPIGIRVKRPAENMQSVIPLLRRLHNVRAFDASWGATDDLVKCVENWPLLEALTLTASPLVSDEGIRYVRGLDHLAYLQLCGTSVSDSGLKNIGSLEALVDLNLRETQVTDVGIAHLTSLKHLERLDLGRTRIGDKGLESIRRLESLKALFLNSTQVSDAGIGSLSPLCNLQILYLADTDLTDVGVAKLRPLHRLHSLCLRGALATEGVMKEFDQKQSLEITGLRTKADLLNLDNPVDVAALRHGGLSVETNDLRNVTRVEAGWDDSIGDLVPKLKNLHSITVLKLPRGSTDADLLRVCELKSLRTLIVEQAAITDASTVNIGRLTELRELSFAYCQSLGDLTAARLSPLTKLESLDLSSTGVTDVGLKRLAPLRSLAKLRLDRTTVGDAGLGEVANLESLVQLGIDRTAVTDAGLVHLKGLKKLRCLDAAETAITASGADRLRKALPELSSWPDYPNH